MRVRLNRSVNDDRRDSPERARLRLVRDESAPVAQPAPAVPPRDTTEEFAAERRMRDSGGPDDTATYHCACGYVFEAPVSTGVACPHCGTGQAW
jgi:hypothetical protein